MKNSKTSNQQLLVPKSTTSRRSFLTNLRGVTTAGILGYAPIATSSFDNSAFAAESKESFKEMVTRQLEILTQVTSSEGAIQLEVNALREKLNVVIAKMDRCENLIGDYNDVNAVNNSLLEIKRHLGIP
jgi:hypothetical protein